MAKPTVSLKESDPETSPRRHGFILSPKVINRLVGYFYSKELNHAYSLFNEKKFRVSNEDISYRVINHWEKAGVITPERANEGGWRYYSLIELIWLELVSELRKFGFSLSKIRKVKDNLAALVELKLSTRSFTGYEMLEFWSALTLAIKLPVYAVVFNNCEISVLSEEERYNTFKDGTADNYINISLNRILKSLLPDIDFTPVYDIKAELSNAELDVLLLLRSGTYSAINLITKSGKIERVEATEIFSTNQNISNLLKDGKYQNLQIVQRDGRVITIKRTLVTKYL